MNSQVKTAVYFLTFFAVSLLIISLCEAEDPPPFLFSWGTEGQGNGEFYYPKAIAINSSDNVYVLDYIGQVQKFTSDGEYLTKWDATSGETRGIAVNSLGDVYITDKTNHRILKFDSEGTLSTIWGSIGSGEGELSMPIPKSLSRLLPGFHLFSRGYSQRNKP